MTALHHATIQGHIEIVRLLIDLINKYHLMVDMPDKQGLTPYIYAKRLGFYAISELLLDEGQCCPKQFDNVLHKSVDEWINIGIQEKKDFAKKQHREIVEQFKIRGKISSNMAQKDSVGILRLQLPAINFIKCDPLPSRGKIIKHKTNVQMTPRSSKQFHDHSGHRNTNISYTSSDYYLKANSIHEGSSGKVRRDHHFGTRLDDGYLSQSRGLTPLNHPQLPNNCLQPDKSTDTAFTLLGMQQSSDFTHMTQFFRSELDPNKVAGSSGVIGEIHSILDLLSQQQSNSYRVTTTNQRPSVVPTKLGVKTKGSTLAVLFHRSKVQVKRRTLGYNKHRKKRNG